MLRNNKGITLLALVLTIIILFILASVATISGISTVHYIKFNNARAQFEVIQSKVNIWRKQLNNDKNEDVLEYGEDLFLADNQKVVKTLDGKNSRGYRYFSATYLKQEFDIDGISYNFLINIKTGDVLLYDGIVYQGNWYYSAENFGIKVVEPE